MNPFYKITGELFPDRLFRARQLLAAEFYMNPDEAEKLLRHTFAHELAHHIAESPTFFKIEEVPNTGILQGRMDVLVLTREEAEDLVARAFADGARHGLRSYGLPFTVDE